MLARFFMTRRSIIVPDPGDRDRAPCGMLSSSFPARQPLARSPMTTDTTTIAAMQATLARRGYTFDESSSHWRARWPRWRPCRSRAAAGRRGLAGAPTRCRPPGVMTTRRTCSRAAPAWPAWRRWWWCQWSWAISLMVGVQVGVRGSLQKAYPKARVPCRPGRVQLCCDAS